MEQDMAISILEQIHDGKNHIGEYLSFIFKDRNIHVWWKDVNSIWQGSNQLTAHFFGRFHSEEMIGKSDFDLSWKDSDAELFVSHDQDVLRSSKPMFNIIEPQQYRTNKERVFLNVTKMPVYNNMKIIGTVGFGSLAQSNSNNYVAMSHLRDSCQTFQQDKNYYILVNDKTIRLTSKQAAVLTYLSTGKTVKQIASILNCASSNVEDHIYRLKQKLGVYVTSALRDCFWANPIRWF